MVKIHDKNICHMTSDVIRGHQMSGMILICMSLEKLGISDCLSSFWGKSENVAPQFLFSNQRSPPLNFYHFWVICFLFCLAMVGVLLKARDLRTDIWQVFPSHNICLLPRVFFGFLDLCMRVLEVHVSSWAPGYFYLRFGVTQIFNEKNVSDILGGVSTPQTSKTPQNRQN